MSRSTNALFCRTGALFHDGRKWPKSLPGLLHQAARDNSWGTSATVLWFPARRHCASAVRVLCRRCGLPCVSIDT